MGNLTKRVITAVVLVILLWLVLFQLPAPAGILMLGFFLLVGSWEWAGFFAGSAILKRFLFVGLLVGIAVAEFFAGSPIVDAEPALYVGALYWTAVALVLLRGLPVTGVLATGLAGAVALICAWFASLLLLQSEAGPQFLLCCAGIVAAADIGAYFTGKKFGRHRLAPAISPGKTIEGFIGGLLLAGLVAGLCGYWLGRNVGIFAIAGVVIGVVSVIGDLWVSRFKRSAGIKDSGRILPGHGGVMDRIDSLMAALPFFALLIISTEGSSV